MNVAAERDETEMNTAADAAFDAFDALLFALASDDEEVSTEDAIAAFEAFCEAE